MSDRPIIFSAPMVRALLDGRKSQTRRLVKPQPDVNSAGLWVWPPASACKGNPDSWVKRYGGFTQSDAAGLANFLTCQAGRRLSYAPGDRLWVREAWSHTERGVWTISDARSGLAVGEPIYAADGRRPGAKYWPSIHMPREFSRLTLTVTDVRVQRLQEISEDDAWDEGVTHKENGGHFAREGFMRLWNSIHGPGAWEANPWVSAINFTVERKNVDE